jgi:pimeloyl-ACP methyl ester carboxylesterase
VTESPNNGHAAYGRLMTEVRPFTIDMPDAALDDLHARLRNTRWPDAEVVDDWSQGTPLSYVQELCDYWLNTYDWRARETALNRFDQFITEIDGLDIHFVHHRSPHADATPLILSHGWPGSIVEFHKVIEPLTNPTEFGGDAADAFHVVAPSLPGYGFSAKPTETGWGIEKIGGVFAKLMARLGYASYVAQGGDWGAGITHSIGALDPLHCQAIHMTLAMGARPGDLSDPTPAELHALERAGYYAEWDSGYSKQQSTRPQTVGYGLVDSPSAQAAWIIEKYWAWTDNDGHPEDVLTRDELLDNIMLYWINGNGASSARLYWESFGKRKPLEIGDIPVGFASFPREVVPPVRSWVEPMYPGLCHWAEYDKGGHFAAFEVPETFVNEVRTFFRNYR